MENSIICELRDEGKFRPPRSSSQPKTKVTCTRPLTVRLGKTNTLFESIPTSGFGTESTTMVVTLCVLSLAVTIGHAEPLNAENELRATEELIFFHFT